MSLSVYRAQLLMQGTAAVWLTSQHFGDNNKSENEKENVALKEEDWVKEMCSGDKKERGEK